MASKYRPPSAYWNGRRIASAVSGSHTPSTSGGEDVITEDGYMGVTDGAEINEVQIERAMKVTGDGLNLSIHEVGTLTLSPVNGQVLTIPNCTVMERPSSWDHKAGTMTGSFRFRGGKATYTG
jgi:hypothetical protein